MMSDAQIANLLEPYGFVPTQELSEGIRKYTALLLRWNQRISLTTVTNPVEIIKFHFGESLFALSRVHMDAGRLADIGSGAGFPGLPLAMANADLDVTLIEADTRKAAFLSEAVRELGLRSAHVIRARMEEFPENPGYFDFITARALGQYEKLLRWSAGRLSDKGKVVLWLGEGDVLSLSKGPSWQWGDAVRIPESKRRFLLVGGPLK